MRIEDYVRRFGMNDAAIQMETASEFISRISREYSLYVLKHRHIPHIGDGLKTSQRIGLWIARSYTSEKKTMAVVGEMMSSNLYVHGDQSAADALSRLAAPWLNNYPLLQGEGYFGSRIEPDGAGAPRYTHVKRAAFAQDNLYVDMDVLPMVENYDGSTRMPATFLPLIPLVLLNGVEGIATGWSTKILPRRLEDLQRAVRDVIQTGSVRTSLLPNYRRYNCSVIPTSTPNRYVLKGQINITNTSTVTVTELPPDVKLERFKSTLNDLEEKGLIQEWSDRSTGSIDVEIKMKRADLEKETVDSLIEKFGLASSVTERIVVIDPTGDHVQPYERAEDLVVDFVRWRLQWYAVRYEWLRRREHEHIRFLLSFLSCFEPKSGQSVAQRIRKFTNRQALRQAVIEAITMNQIEVVEENVERITTLPVYRWTREGFEETKRAIRESETKIAEYTDILAHPERQKSIYANEVNQIDPRKYGYEREEPKRRRKNKP